MTYRDLCNQAHLREDLPAEEDYILALQLLSKYLEMTGQDYFGCIVGSPIENLLIEYFQAKGTKEEEIFRELFASYEFNYSMSVHNAIYYLLATEKERDDRVSPLSWPGVNEIKRDGSKYILDTILGNIEIYKASEVLCYSKSSYIFDRTLMGQCYERSYEFLRENQDYKAVLSYMPNFFYGGHYHAYLEKESEVLDIASNAIYYSKESANKILCGEIVATLSYKQVQQKYNMLKKVAPDISSNNKLLTLALYYDKQNHN